MDPFAEPKRWTNPSLPQTLQIAVILLYINAFFDLLNVLGEGVLTRLLQIKLGNDLLGSLVIVGIVVGQVAGGFGIANERKQGYKLAVAMAFSPAVLRIWLFGVDALLSRDLLGLMFEVALIALLLHPQSNEYQRIWFR